MCETMRVNQVRYVLATNPDYVRGFVSCLQKVCADRYVAAKGVYDAANAERAHLTDDEFSVLFTMATRMERPWCADPSIEHIWSVVEQEGNRALEDEFAKTFGIPGVSLNTLILAGYQFTRHNVDQTNG